MIGIKHESSSQFFTTLPLSDIQFYEIFSPKCSDQDRAKCAKAGSCLRPLCHGKTLKITGVGTCPEDLKGVIEWNARYNKNLQAWRRAEYGKCRLVSMKVVVEDEREPVRDGEGCEHENVLTIYKDSGHFEVSHYRCPMCGMVSPEKFGKNIIIDRTWGKA